MEVTNGEYPVGAGFEQEGKYPIEVAKGEYPTGAGFGTPVQWELVDHMHLEMAG